MALMETKRLQNILQVEKNHQEVLKKDAILKITEYERGIFEKRSMTSWRHWPRKKRNVNLETFPISFDQSQRS